MPVPLRALAPLLLALASPALQAADPFEIQIYDGEANAPGVLGLELHTNYSASSPDAAAPLLAQRHQLHLTLEPSLGVTPWLELGAYLQTTVRADGGYDYAGAKLRAKLVTPPGFHAHLRLGINLEAALVPQAYSAVAFSTELRPIVAWEDERMLLAVNPIVGVTFDGTAPTLEPAAGAKLKLGKVALGLEYLTGLGTLSSIGPLRQQEHYLFETVDLLDSAPFELNLGVGEGLTQGSNGLVFKAILGFTFEPLWK